MQILLLTLIIQIGLVSAVYAQASPTALVKGAEGMSPIDYFELTQEAEQSFAQRDYAKAAAAFEQLTKAYPFDGEMWYLLGRSRYENKEFAAAAVAFEKAHEFGVSAYVYGQHANLNDYAGYNLPRFAVLSYARSNQPERTLDWLERALIDYHLESPQRFLENEVFNNLRKNPRFQKLAGRLPSDKTSRTEGWRIDLDYLLMQIKRVNPVYNRQPLPAELVRDAEILRKNIPKLSDAQIAVEMQHLLSLLKQTHNNFYFPFLIEQNARVKFPQLPVTFYIFPEGLYIIDAVDTELIGARVLSFDGNSFERVYEASKYLKDRENEMELVQTAPVYMGLPQVLHALKMLKQPDRAELAIVDRNGKTRTVTLNSTADYRGWNKIQAPRLSETPAPLYLQKPDDNFWFELLPDKQTLYFQFNQVVPKRDETLAQFGIRFKNYLNENKVRNLIVDARRNNGGNTYFYRELLRTLTNFDAQDGNKLFVIIGRRTFSATANFITDVDRMTNAVFVGEPSSGKPITVGGDLTDMSLPYSRLQLGIAGASWKLTSPRDTRLWIAPEVPVELKAGDYFANRDPAIDAIMVLVGKGQKEF